MPEAVATERIALRDAFCFADKVAAKGRRYNLKQSNAAPLIFDGAAFLT
jgi:hypothetical protein